MDNANMQSLDRLPTEGEAASAAATLLRCNGWDLDVWSDGNWPVDAQEFLHPIASRRREKSHESSTRANETIDIALADVERKFPGAFWHFAKGRVRATEPLFGFQVLFGTEEVLAEGEGDTAVAAIYAALGRAA